MFEIRIVCEAGDVDRVTAALAQSCITGPARLHTARSTDTIHLYRTADYRPAATTEWPSPDEAYTGAPSIGHETQWCSDTVASPEFDGEGDRESWLRRSALLDREVLSREFYGDPVSALSLELAVEAARHLMDIDDAAVICDPCHYVRQQYALWRTHH